MQAFNAICDERTSQASDLDIYLCADQHNGCVRIEQGEVPAGAELLEGFDFIDALARMETFEIFGIVTESQRDQIADEYGIQNDD